jgi:hypothetical protein
MRRGLGIALFGVVALCVTAVPAAADVWNKAWPVTGAAQIVLNADDGNIQVEIGDSAQVKAVVRTVGWHIADNEVRITERQNGNRVELELKLPSKTFQFSIRREITIELTVPRVADVDLHTGDGNIMSRGLEGTLRCDTGDGNIAAMGGKGNIRLHTGDGNIHTDELDGSLTADTGDGNVSVAGRFEALEVQTGDGNVDVTAHAGSRLASGWKLRTGDGNVTVNLPDGVAADLDAHTGDGRVSCEFTVSVSGKVEPTSLRGPMNGGGLPLAIHTGDGNIKIAKR